MLTCEASTGSWNWLGLCPRQPHFFPFPHVLGPADIPRGPGSVIPCSPHPVSSAHPTPRHLELAHLTYPGEAAHQKLALLFGPQFIPLSCGWP